MTELEGVSCQFIIGVSQRPGDVGGAVAGHVLNQSKEKMPLVLHEWFATRNAKDWFKKVLPLKPTRDDDSQAQITLHQRWCELAGIKSTPAIFFNGIEIPRHYTTSEIKKVVNFLNEKTTKLT